MKIIFAISFIINDRDSLRNKKNEYFLNSLKYFQIKKENYKNNLRTPKFDKNNINKSQMILIIILVFLYKSIKIKK